MSDRLAGSGASRDGLEGLDLVLPDHVRRRLAERASPWRVACLGGAEAMVPGAMNGAGPVRRACLPGQRRSLAVRGVCGVVRVIAGEMVFLTGGTPHPLARNRRFVASHVQQIAMYVCHVVLQMTMTEIAQAFGRDRTTVGHACARVEDRRDDGAYDALISAVERVVGGVFAPSVRERV